MSKTLLEEALADAKTLKESALENAKNVLVEAMSPKIKEFVESQLGESGMFPDEDAKEPGNVGAMSPSGADGMHEQHGDELEDLELLQKLGLLGDFHHEGGGFGEDEQIFGDESGEEEEVRDHDHEEEELEHEHDDEEEEEERSHEDEEEEDKMKEAHDQECGKDEKKEDKLEEMVEITNEDLKAALSEVLGSLKEASVTKGFADGGATRVNDGARGLADEKKGEHQWKDEEPPHAKDWTVKEAKQAIRALQEQNATLVKENTDYKKAYGVLRSKLQEVNLFNSKLLFTHKVFSNTELNNKQRLGIIEAFDRAQTMREVELVYKSLSESFRIAGVVSESKQERASKAKSSRLSTPSSTVLKESVLKEEKTMSEGKDNFAARMQELAGILE